MVRFYISLILVAFASLGYWLLYGQPLMGMDDANIYFTYAKNLVNGHGFVYYPGGEQVEGFTSFLWTLVIALLYFVSPKYFTVLIMALCVILTAFSLSLCLRFIRRQTNAREVVSPQELLFMALLILIPGFIDWTVLSQMETGLWSLFLVLITLRIAAPGTNSGSELAINAILLSLLVSLRPESLLWCIVFTGLMFVKQWLDKKNLLEAIRGVLPVGAAVILTVAALTAFRLLYFGYPLPNTYYAKVSSDLAYNLFQGVRYLVFCCIQSPALLLIIAASLISLALLLLRTAKILRARAKESVSAAEWTQFVLVVVTFVSLFIPVYVGGDHFKLLRFLQPFFPLYYLLFFNIPFWKKLADVKLHLRPAFHFLLVILLVPFIYMSSATPLHTYIKDTPPLEWEFALAELGRKDAGRIESMFSKLETPPTVGVSAAGGFGYAYQGVVYDLMGLNNAQMAHALEVKTGIKNHAAFDKKVFFQMKPDVFHGYFKTSSFVNTPDDSSLLENEPGFEQAYVSRMYKQLFTDPHFIATYKPVIIGDGGPYLKTYAHVEFIERLKNKGYKVVELSRRSDGRERAEVKVGSVY